MAWTKKRVELLARYRLEGAKLVIVVNGEPYIHTLQEGKIRRLILAGRLGDEWPALADEIDWQYGGDRWKPILFLYEHRPPEDVFLLGRIAAAWIVSSLYDGMNLVAKEFVASRNDEQGVLALSPFTGAAREVDGALLFNPCAFDEFAEALHAALTMPTSEQKRRMRMVRQLIADHNVYRWAGLLLTEMDQMMDCNKSSEEAA